MPSLAEAIDGAELTSHAFLIFPDGFKEGILEGISDPLKVFLKKNLDDGGIVSFVRNEIILSILMSGESLPIESQRRLTTYKIFKKPLEGAKIVVDKLSRLPLNYMIAVRASITMSDVVDRPDVEIKLNDQLSIVSGKRLPQGFVLKSGNDDINKYLRSQRFSDFEKISISDNNLYFLYRASGVISDMSDTKIVREMGDGIRAFYGSCLAHSLIFDFDWGFHDAHPIVVANLMHNGEDQELCYLSFIEDDIRRSTQSETTGEFDRRIKEGEAFEEILDPMCRMFQTDEASRLMTAAIWIHRSHLSSRGMDRVLESAIAMEVLLGRRLISAQPEAH